MASTDDYLSVVYGLGFSYAQESILGRGPEFDQAKLDTLEPLSIKRGHSYSAAVAKLQSPRKKTSVVFKTWNKPRSSLDPISVQSFSSGMQRRSMDMPESTRRLLRSVLPLDELPTSLREIARLKIFKILKDYHGDIALDAMEIASSLEVDMFDLVSIHENKDQGATLSYAQALNKIIKALEVESWARNIVQLDSDARHVALDLLFTEIDMCDADFDGDDDASASDSEWNRVISDCESLE